MSVGDYVSLSLMSNGIQLSNNHPVSCRQMIGNGPTLVTDVLVALHAYHDVWEIHPQSKDGRPLSLNLGKSRQGTAFDKSVEGVAQSMGSAR